MSNCSKCKKEYDDVDFGSNSLGNRFKMCIHCRSKRVEYNKQYYIKNKERVLESKKAYVQNNLDKVKEYQKLYREKNREALNIRGREYKEKNLDKVKETNKRYRDKLKSQNQFYFK